MRQWFTALGGLGALTAALLIPAAAGAGGDKKGEEKGGKGGWVKLFNGNDLTGW
jgi:hypothetical protein